MTPKRGTAETAATFTATVMTAAPAAAPEVRIAATAPFLMGEPAALAIDAPAALPVEVDARAGVVVVIVAAVEPPWIRRCGSVNHRTRRIRTAENDFTGTASQTQKGDGTE